MQKLSDTFDIAVVGSGFAGSLLAMIANRLGRSVVLIEKGTHPRVVIGESSTPLSNLLLDEMAIRYDLPAVRALAKWGSWQRAYPEISCGLKRGFTFHHHVLGAAGIADAERGDQLLVAASPRDEIADMHWYRADFDHLLVREAQKLGVEYVDRVALERFCDYGSEVRLEGRRDGRERVRNSARRLRGRRLTWRVRPAPRAYFGGFCIGRWGSRSAICQIIPRRRLFIRISPGLGGSGMGSLAGLVRRFRPIPLTTRRCITFSTADGFGCCSSITE